MTTREGLAVMERHQMNLVTRTSRGAKLKTVLAAIGFAALADFQAALAAGAPWGHAAWGGRKRAPLGGPAGRERSRGRHLRGRNDDCALPWAHHLAGVK